MLSRLYLLPDHHGKRYAAMEGLRAFAVWLVFLTHLSENFGAVVYHVNASGTPMSELPEGKLKLLAWAARSHYGVDLFFILSGFLVMRMMIARQGRFNLLAYLWQRVLRIYPAFLLSLVVVTWISVRDGLIQYAPDVFLKNLFLLNGLVDFGVPGYNGVTWSLTFEFLFYILCPIVLLFAPLGVLRSPLRYSLFAVGVFLILMCLHQFYTRCVMFLAGGLLAVHRDEELAAIVEKIPEWVVVGLYLTATTIFAVKTNIQWDRFAPMFCVVGSLLVAKACYGRGLLNRLCNTVGMRCVGNLSYSFYLIHGICIYLVCKQVPRWDAWIPSHKLQFAIAFVISLAVSFLAATVLFLVAERGYFYNQRLAGRVRFQAAVVMPAACVVVLMFCSPEIIASVRDRFPTLPMAYNQDNKFRGVQVSGTGQGQQRDGALVIDSFDIDPQILLPALPASLNHSPVLSVELGVSADTYFQVFYQADPNRCYTEAESSRLPLHRGKNTVKVNLPPSAAGTRLRIDPMARPGQVAIRSITIR
jgi:peptidoglycan/LPS O-acetylase OafA/YrhL